MAGLLGAIQTGASGLYSNQTGLDVTGNNLANINTAGYSRQHVTITSSPSLNDGGLLLGTGSSVEAIQRAEDPFVTKQLIRLSVDYGRYEAKTVPLDDVERALGLDQGNLSEDLDTFFDSWQALSHNPSGVTERQQVLLEAQSLADQFHDIDQQLTDVVEGVNTSLIAQVDPLNEQLQQIAALNLSILSAESSGANANSLQDQRDILVQQVAETTGATAFDQSNGMISLQLPNGLPLVNGSEAATVGYERVDGAVNLSLVSGESRYDLQADDLGGTLQGLLEVRDGDVPELRDEIDRLAYELANAVNAIHRSGVDGNGDPGQELFSLTAPTDPLADPWQGAAATLGVALSEPNEIVTGTTGLSGDNSLTVDLAALRNSSLIDGATLGEEYARIAADVGLRVSSNEQKLSISEETLIDVNNQRDSLVGVSSDQEMLMLTQYQTGYEAASRYISAVKDMLDVLMAM